MLSLALSGAAAGGGVVVAGGPAGGLAAGVCAGNVPARLSPTNTANVHNTALIGHPDSGCNGRVDGATISQLEPRTTRQIILLSRRGRQAPSAFRSGAFYAVNAIQCARRRLALLTASIVGNISVIGRRCWTN